MKVRVHLVVERDPLNHLPGRRVDMTTTIEAVHPAGSDPVIGSVRAVADLTVNAIKEITR
jgi:hypothetical protein